MSCNCLTFPLTKVSWEEFDYRMSLMPRSHREIAASPYMYCEREEAVRVWPKGAKDIELVFPLKSPAVFVAHRSNCKDKPK